MCANTDAFTVFVPWYVAVANDNVQRLRCAGAYALRILLAYPAKLNTDLGDSAFCLVRFSCNNLP